MDLVILMSPINKQPSAPKFLMREQVTTPIRHKKDSYVALEGEKRYGSPTATKL